MPINQGQLSFGKERLQYAGAPVEAYKYAIETLYSRAAANDASMLQLQDYASNIDVRAVDEPNKQEALLDLNESFNEIVNTNSYAYAGRDINAAARKFQDNQALKYSIKQKADLNAVVAKAEEDGVSPDRINQWKQIWHATGKRITVDEETGTVKNYASYRPLAKDVDINAKVLNLIDEFKANEQPLTDAEGNILTPNNGRWYAEGKTESVSPERVYNAALTMVLTDPEIRPYLEEQAVLDQYNRYVADPQTGKYIEDANGNYIEGNLVQDANGNYGIKPIDYVARLGAIGINQEYANSMVEQFNKENGTAYTLDTPGLAKMLYDNNYITQLADKHAKFAVNVGSYSKMEVDYKQNAFALENLRHQHALIRQQIKAKQDAIIAAQKEAAKKKKEDANEEVNLYVDTRGNEAAFKNVQSEYSAFRNTIDKSVNDNKAYLDDLLNKMPDVIDTDGNYHVDIKPVIKNGLPVGSYTFNIVDKNGNIVNVDEKTKMKIISNFGTAYDEYKTAIFKQAEINNQELEFINKLSKTDKNELAESLISDYKLNILSNLDVSVKPLFDKLKAADAEITRTNRELNSSSISKSDPVKQKAFKDAKDKYNQYKADLIKATNSNDNVRELFATRIIRNKPEIIKDYYNYEQVGFGKANARYWTPSSKTNQKTLNVNTKQQLLNVEKPIYTTRNKDFRKFTTDDLMDYFNLNTIDSGTKKDAIRKYFDNVKADGILTEISKNISETSTNVYNGMNGTGTLNGVIGNIHFEVDISDGNGEMVSLVAPALFVDLPPNYNVELDKADMVLRKIAIELSQGHIKNKFINLDVYKRPEYAIQYKLDDKTKLWDLYDANGTKLNNKQYTLEEATARHIQYFKQLDAKQSTDNSNSN